MKIRMDRRVTHVRGGEEFRSKVTRPDVWYCQHEQGTPEHALFDHCAGLYAGKGVTGMYVHETVLGKLHILLKAHGAEMSFPNGSGR